MFDRRWMLGLILTVAASNAQAAGVVQLDWDSCNSALVNKQVVAGSITVFYVSLLGHAEPHKAYELRMNVVPQAETFPDSWRFDPPGCQGSSFITMDYTVATAFESKVCPSFVGTIPAVPIRDYAYDPVSGLGKLSFLIAYPGGSSRYTASQRYMLLRVLLDHSYSTASATVPGETCGGLSTPVCIHLTTAAWLTMDGVEIPWSVAQPTLSSNDPAGACASATPARASTWGSIKDQYRR
jgi:hypothetical protein